MFIGARSCRPWDARLPVIQDSRPQSLVRWRCIGLSCLIRGLNILTNRTLLIQLPGLRFLGRFSGSLPLLLMVASGLNGQPIGPGNQMSCSTNVSATPTVRGEGYTERVGDFGLFCSGGTPTPAGAPVPTVNMQIFLNTSVTSRLFTDTWSEALLIVDEPGSGLPGTSNTQLACSDPNGVCTITGTGTGIGTYDGSAGRPNVFQGRVSGNSVIFQGIPLDGTPSPSYAHVFRFVNIRVNASALNGGSAAGATPVIASFSLTGGVNLLVANPTPTVAFVISGESFTVRTADNQALSSGFSPSRCGQSTPQRAGTLRFMEQFGTAFATRTTAPFVDSDTSPTPIGQTVPGAIYNTETGFYSPTLSAPTGDYGAIGLASAGTRLRAVINNIPTGSAVYVSVNRVDFVSGNPVNTATGLVTRLIQNESTSFAPLTSTGTLDGIPVVQLPISNGVATAVWEVLRTNPNAIETADFPVWVLPGAASPNGTATVNGSLAPAPPTFQPGAGGSASNSLPVPRFVADTQFAASLFTVGACAVTFTTPASLADGIVGVAYSQQLAAIGGLPPITFSLIGGAPPTGVNVSSTGALSGSPQAAGDYSFTVVAADSGGNSDTRTFKIRVWTLASPSLRVTKTHTGNFTQGQTSAAYTVTVTNAQSTDATRGTVTVSEVIPDGLTLLSMSGAGWNCSFNTCSSLGPLLPGTSYPITVTVSVAADAASPLLNQVLVSGGGSPTAFASDSTIVNPGSAANGLRFVPVTPCRLADTRNANGSFGGPALVANGSRSFAIPAGACNIPPGALAYSLNVTVVPHGPLGYLTLWPTGQIQPLASTLNSLDGRVKANSALVPAGSNGAVSVFATNATDVVLDINGYFLPATSPTAQAFYPLPPCRIVDTREAAGPLGGPVLAGGVTRHIPVASSTCGNLSGATAFSLNLTVVPRGALGYLSTWPTGQTQPVVSTLNAPTGAITANAAIVPAGSGGSIDVFATNTTDLVIDINGYFGPAVSPGALSLYTLNPCRILDTRDATGPLGGPILSGSRSIPASSANCGIPASAQALSLNATVVPATTLGYLTLWSSGTAQPVVSTLNALDGSITANAALVPLGFGAQAGWLSAFSTDQTHLILDTNGYFAQ